MTTPIANVPVSTVPAVRAYLFAQFQANITRNPNPSWTFGVFWDEPGTNVPHEMVQLGGVRNRRVTPFQIVGSGGPGWMKEEYDLTVTITVLHGGDNPQDTDAAAYALLAQVEQIVRSDPKFGGLVIVAHPQESRDKPSWDAQHKGRFMPIECTIHVSAQI